MPPTEGTAESFGAIDLRQIDLAFVIMEDIEEILGPK
jgi:hypothetical protein